MKRTLLVIAIVALVLLGAAFGLQEITHINAQKSHVAMMELLLPDGKNFEKVEYTGDDTVIRSVHKADNGFVIETATQGYVDEITLLVGVNNSGTVTGVVTYRAHETYGLGSRILNDYRFLAQFLSKSGTFSIGTADTDAYSGATDTTETADDATPVDGISGATVSSKAVVKCVNSAVAYVTGADIESSATSWGG